MSIFLTMALLYVITLLVSVFVLIQTGVQDKIVEQVTKFGEEGVNLVGFVVFLLSPVVVLILLPAWLLKTIKVIFRVVFQVYKGE